jgi:glycosyltransferase involved in cell wall biosynthesis
MAAAHLARLDAGAGLADRVGVLPFAMEDPGTARAGFSERTRREPDCLSGRFSRWGQGPAPTDDAVIAHFGIVDPVKDPELVIEAFSKSRSRTVACLVFVGPVDDALLEDLLSTADHLGVGDAVTFTGPLSPETYRAWLACAEIAVQLRRSFNGEASAAVGECCACGVATIVSDLGWAGELPDGAVRKVPPTVSADRLAGVIDELAADGAARQHLGDQARRVAGEHSFARAARTLVSLVLDSPARTTTAVRTSAS